MGTETIYQKKNRGLLTLVDLVYSPDDNGYYLEKWIFNLDDDNDTKNMYSKKTYPSRRSAVKAFKDCKVKWNLR